MASSFFRCVVSCFGNLVLACVSIAATAGPARQFQLTTGATAPGDIDKYYRSPSNLKDFPIRSLWTRKDRSSWIEQDARMKQRIHEVVEIGAMVGETKGLLLRLRGHREPGEAAEETFIPLPEGPVAAPAPEVRRRKQVPGAAPSDWESIGRASWCGEAGSATEPKPPISPISLEPSQLREWKSRDGSRTLKAVLLGGTPNQLKFRLESGKSITAGLDHFADDDQLVLMRWLESNPWPVRYPSTVRVPMSEGKGLTRVARPLNPNASEDQQEPFTYETRHFDFSSTVQLGESHLHAVGVSFEATRRMLGALPWSLPLPGGSGSRSQIQLFQTRAQYRAAGGSDLSAGFYQPSSRVFYVPFESIGLSQEQDRSYKLDKGRIIFDTLHHELTHQQMHEILNFLPMWIIEGSAEFVGNLPYAEGVFRLDAEASHLRRFFAPPTRLSKKLAERPRAPGESKKPPVPYVPLAEVLSEVHWPQMRSGITFLPGQGEDPQKTRNRYNSSFLLVYYFVHLDPDRSRLPRFFLSARRMALEVSSVERHGQSYQRQRVDPHNWNVLENHARVDAYNRLVAEYNASLTAGGSLWKIDPPIWAELPPPPPPFRPTGGAAVFFRPGATFGVSALTWSPPSLANQPTTTGGGPGTDPPRPRPEQPPSPKVSTPLPLWVPLVAESEADSDLLNKTPLAAAILENQNAAFGTPAEVSARVPTAFAEHGFPLPDADRN